MERHSVTVCFLYLSTDFPVKGFEGKKTVILSNMTWMGGKSTFLAYLYLMTSCICFILLIIFVIVDRKFGQMYSLPLFHCLYDRPIDHLCLSPDRKRCTRLWIIEVTSACTSVPLDCWRRRRTALLKRQRMLRPEDGRRREEKRLAKLETVAASLYQFAITLYFII